MRSEAERTAIAEHLTYELSMLWAMAQAIGRVPAGGLGNAVIEAFALHARNVVDFFFTAPQHDDVAAEQFFTEQRKWAAIRPALSPLLEASRRRANKEVSHLTYSRLLVSPENKPWPAAEIVAALDPTVHLFCQHADLLPESVKLLRYRELLP